MDSKWLCGLMLVILCGAPVLAAGPGPETVAIDPASLQRVLTMRVEGSVEFDELGKADGLILQTKLIPALDDALHRVAAEWRIAPVRIDGLPRRARSNVRLLLTASKSGEGYSVKIDNVVFPPSLTEASAADWKQETATAIVRFGAKPPPTRYPLGMMRSGVSATVLMAIRVGADGRVAAAMPVQSMILDMTGRDKDMAFALREFERVAVRSAKERVYRVERKSDTVAVADLTGLVPFNFLMEGIKAPAPGEWRNVVRSPRRPITWLAQVPGEQQVGVSDVAGGQQVAVSSPIRLVAPVTGTVLL